MRFSLALILSFIFIFKNTWAQSEFSQMAIDTDKQMKKAGAASATTPPSSAPAASPAKASAPNATPTATTPTTPPTAAPVAPPQTPTSPAPTTPSTSTATSGFSDIKAKLLANLDKKIALINDHRVCIEASQNAEEVKKCDEKLRAENQKLKDEAKQKQMQKIDENIKNLETKKKELEQKP